MPHETKIETDAMVSVHLETIGDNLGESTIQLKWELA